MITFNIPDKSQYILLTKTNLGNTEMYKKHFKEILDTEKDDIYKYLYTIFASYNVCKKLHENKFNIHLRKHCPLFKYEPINTNDDENVELIEADKVYSFYDYYKDSPAFRKNEYPAYSLHYILSEYVEKKLDIEVRWEIIDSPCTKDTFVVKVFDKDEEYEYLRNQDGVNEFTNNQEGIKDAAFRIFLFYNKYI